MKRNKTALHDVVKLFNTGDRYVHRPKPEVKIRRHHIPDCQTMGDEAANLFLRAQRTGMTPPWARTARCGRFK